MNEQQSDEWFKERLGFCTASNFACVIRGNDKKTKAKYIRRIVAERLTQKPVEDIKTFHMKRGNEQESAARMQYEARTGNVVDTVGFIKHKEIMAGCSPDGLIGKTGGIEIKSVTPITQIETIENDIVPAIHLPQIQGAMWITGRKFWDFISYSADMPEPMNLFIKTVKRDNQDIKVIEHHVREFLNEVDLLILKLMQGK